MICPKCGFQNPDGAKFCQKCANIFESPPRVQEEKDMQKFPEKVEEKSIQDLSESKNEASLLNSNELEQSKREQIVNSNNLIDFKNLLKKTFSLIKKGFWKYILINFIGVVVIPVVLTLLSFLLLKISNSFGWLLPIIFLLIYYFVFWKQAVFVKFIDKINHNEKAIPFKSGFSSCIFL